MFDEVMMEIEEHFEKSVDSLQREFQRLRTGRANPAMVDHVIVEAYGSTMPLKQMASISVPEPTQLLIKPWDKGTLKDIERALIAANLGTSPVNDGIRVCLRCIKQAATASEEVPRFTSRNSRMKKGIKNWKTMSNTATICQPPRVRLKYQGISSVRLPLHVIKYCMNDM